MNLLMYMYVTYICMSSEHASVPLFIWRREHFGIPEYPIKYSALAHDRAENARGKKIVSPLLSISIIYLRTQP